MSDEGRSTAPGSFWRSLRALLLGAEEEPTLRDQIEEVIEEHEREPNGRDDMSPAERQMLLNLLHFGERRVIDVAVPRGDILAFDLKGSFADLVQMFAEAGHSRMPVYADTLDNVQGFIHVRDVYTHLASQEPRKEPGVRSLIRPVLFVPESMGVLDLLARMRAERTHLALVVDEFGGIDGLVTIEDLVEEIVGDIEDEYDEQEAAQIVPLGDGRYEVDARVSLDDLRSTVDTRLIDEEEEVDTLGGLAFMLAGHVPDVGEVVEHPSGWRLEVIEGDARRIGRLRLYPPPAVAGAIIEA